MVSRPLNVCVFHAPVLEGNLTPGITRPYTTYQAFKLTDESWANSGRVHAVVRLLRRAPLLRLTLRFTHLYKEWETLARRGFFIPRRPSVLSSSIDDSLNITRITPTIRESCERRPSPNPLMNVDAASLDDAQTPDGLHGVDAPCAILSRAALKRDKILRDTIAIQVKRESSELLENGSLFFELLHISTNEIMDARFWVD